MLLGIRPEHVTIVEGAGQEGISATVDIVQPLGDEQIVDLSLKDGTVIKMIAPLELELAPADKLLVDLVRIGYPSSMLTLKGESNRVWLRA